MSGQPFTLPDWPARRPAYGTPDNGTDEDRLFRWLHRLAITTPSCQNSVFHQACRRAFGPAENRFNATLPPRNLLTVARIRVSDGFWEPDADSRSKVSWHWILAVRDGLPHPDFTDAGIHETLRQAALSGRDVIDLVAVSADLQRVVARLTGAAAVFGAPQEPSLIRHPIHLRATPRAWIDAGYAGVVMAGDEADTRAWLAGCAAGVVVPDVKTGGWLKRLLTRPVPAVPPIFVDANDDRETA